MNREEKRYDAEGAGRLTRRVSLSPREGTGCGVHQRGSSGSSPDRSSEDQERRLSRCAGGGLRKLSVKKEARMQAEREVEEEGRE